MCPCLTILVALNCRLSMPFVLSRWEPNRGEEIAEAFSFCYDISKLFLFSHHKIFDWCSHTALDILTPCRETQWGNQAWQCWQTLCPMIDHLKFDTDNMEKGHLKEQGYLVASVTFVISIAFIVSLKITCHTLHWFYAFWYRSGSAVTRYVLGICFLEFWTIQLSVT